MVRICAARSRQQTQPRIKLHLDMGAKFGYWWLEVSHLPAVGSYVVPFDTDSSDIDWEWDHDSVRVVNHLLLVENNLVAVSLKSDGPWEFSPPKGFRDAMIREGWSCGDDEAWE